MDGWVGESFVWAHDTLSVTLYGSTNHSSIMLCRQGSQSRDAETSDGKDVMGEKCGCGMRCVV